MQQRNSATLLLTLLLFGCFALVQVAVALAAHSMALLGDSAVMVVDAASYGLNWRAERRKELAEARKVKLKPEELMQLEVHIPLFSATCLAIVMVAVASDAVVVLKAPAPRLQNVVNEPLAMGLGLVNLAVDGICLVRIHFARTQAGDNVNMCSAVTHVVADTTRSITVVTAAIFARAHPMLDSAKIDGVASLVVGASIALALFILLRNTNRKRRELQAEIRDQELDAAQAETLLATTT